MWEAISEEKPLVIIGCGKMGGAMARGWLKAGLPESHLLVVDPVAARTGVEGISCSCVFPSMEELPANIYPSVIILAIKPQIMDAVLPAVAANMQGGPLIISVAAGTRIGYFSKSLGRDAPIVRVMPNTPASIGCGITTLVANDYVSESQRKLSEQLMKAVGKTVWLSSEDQMNAVTALSGSGPAYVFHMVEAMAAAGSAMGLDDELAMTLARETIAGAGALLSHDTRSAKILREEVTSPKGTTAAGLEVLMGADTNLSQLMRQTVRAAKKRGEELGS
ncbi:pyrroline-5-carboxylate reductase [Temperatibacter marinus]|uniref:Pyrroline-5-carboxylate reductase n=1 Tax=Temperatibacter marinus TaxID=1456591 RepID=A0AA52H821_9PROT|nr:pyrroline-5-carboxylate reductase [Temperatibacter marinus]WND01671.1 pyrroline-5-carboxylate reductase [Temperatibacter marinus]